MSFPNNRTLPDDGEFSDCPPIAADLRIDAEKADTACHILSVSRDKVPGTGPLACDWIMVYSLHEIAGQGDYPLSCIHYRIMPSTESGHLKRTIFRVSINPGAASL